MATAGVPLDGGGRVPSPEEAALISKELLGDLGTRWPHVMTAAAVASQLGGLFDEDEANLLVAAATLHDIGYSPQLVRTGFHSLDGGIYLAEHGFSRRLAALVAHHSLAIVTAPGQGISDLESWFPRELSLVADALAYADMHSGPDGTPVAASDRIDDIAARHTYPGTSQRCRMLRITLDRVRRALQQQAAGDGAAGRARPHQVRVATPALVEDGLAN